MKEALTGHNILLLWILYVLFLYPHFIFFKIYIESEEYQNLNLKFFVADY